MKEIKLRKHKLIISEYKLLLVKTFLVYNEVVLIFENIGTLITNQILFKKIDKRYYYKGVLIKIFILYFKL